MNEEQKQNVYMCIQAIKDEQERHDACMHKLRKALLDNAKHFDSYLEMYIFIRANTPSFEAFCADMREARGVFDKYHDAT